MNAAKGRVIVCVLWNDAHYNTDEVDAAEITHRPWQYITTGVLIRSDEKGVSLSCDIGEDGKFRGRNFVPREMIVREWTAGALLPRARKARRTPQQLPLPTT